MTENFLFTWSGGKDSALALHEIQLAGKYHVAALLTTVTMDYDRISMHGVRRTLLRQQADSLVYPLTEVFISKTSSNEEYEASMRQALEPYLKAGISNVAFGDIFLEDLRKYREENLARAGMKAVFPLWKRDTRELASTFIGRGFKAVITCVDSKMLDGKFAGRYYEGQLIADLPPGVDPCGENGEFHSFVFDGPIFRQPQSVRIGEVVLQDERFYYCDLLPGD